MVEGRHIAPDAAGYWHDTPLTVGRVFEDALALAWRIRLQIAPVILLMTIAAIICNMVLARDVLAPSGGPMTTTTALRDVPAISAQAFATFVVCNLFSIFFTVALTKVLYSGYYEHRDLNPSQTTGIAIGFFRTLGAGILSSILFVTGFCATVIAPLLLVGLIKIGFTFLGNSQSPLEQSLYFIVFAVLVAAIILYSVLALMCIQYIAVGSMIRRDSVFRVIRDGLTFVSSPKRMKRVLALGGILAGVILILTIVEQLVSRLASSVMNPTDGIAVSGILQTLLVVPIFYAFSVVFYTDANKRLALEREVAVSVT